MPSTISWAGSNKPTVLVMKQVESQDKRIDARMGPCPCDQYLEAAKMYCMKKLGLHEPVSGQSQDSYEPAEAPWD
jgi:hypothetical protein